MPMASMIDIVFLLIIFFVVTAEIDQDLQDDHINLASAPHGNPIKKKQPENITVNVRASGEVIIDGNLITADHLQMTFRQKVEDCGKQIPVIIRGDRDVSHEHIQKVIAAIRQAGIYQIKFNAEIKE